MICTSAAALLLKLSNAAAIYIILISALYIELGYTVIVLSNYDGPAAKQVTDWLRERLTQL